MSHLISCFLIRCLTISPLYSHLLMSPCPLFLSLSFSIFFPPSSVIYLYSYHDLFSFFSPLNCLFIIFILCTLPRSVRYQRRPRSHSFPLRIHPKPNRAQCHAGTSSKPASREWWSSLCHSDTCSSACFQGLMPVLDLQHGAFPLPSGKTSPGRVYLFPGNQTQGVA